jgi:YD repeat-containing protein
MKSIAERERIRKRHLLVVVVSITLVHWYAPASASTPAYAVCEGSAPPDFSQCTKYRSTPQLACDDFKAVFIAFVKAGPGWVVDVVNISTPAGNGCALDFSEHNTISGLVIPHDTIPDEGRFYTVDTGFYATARSLTASECGPYPNCVGEPINPATGAVYNTKQDIREETNVGNSINFSRSYNSLDRGLGDLSTGWRHSFSRSINPNQSVPTYDPYVAGNPDYSPLYGDAASACTGGFPQIQSRVPNWASASASYVNGVCILSKSGVNIGTLPIRYSSADVPAPGSSAIGYDVTRDDGQLIRFTIQNGQIVAPPGITMKLQMAGSGYTLIDENDSVETYDGNGKLLSVTSRAGVAQTMSYDSSGRLSGVTDSFGHGLSLSYDTQGRLSSVTRP